MLTRDIGEKAELLTVKELKKLGYKIIERNFLKRCGEIDIIARDREYIVFVEVRFRKTKLYGSGAETVDFRKQKKLINTAWCYLMEHDACDKPARFDVVSISGDPNGEYEIEVIKNAFEAACF